MFIEAKDILDDSHPVLREKCQNVELPLSYENREVLQAMLDYVRNSHDEKFCEEHGIRASVGIAAPQIGRSQKMIAISIPAEEEGQPMIEMALVNPKIISNSRIQCYLANGESCLSVPEDKEGYVPRYYRITVRAYNLLTDKIEDIKLIGYPAIVAQHEIDHLSGKFYYDRINKVDPWMPVQDAIEI